MTIIDATIGAIYLGCIFAALLYGVTNLQVYIYFKNYPKDYKFQRVCVGVLWWALTSVLWCRGLKKSRMLDTLHLSFTIAAVYHYSVTHFGDARELLKLVWPLKAQIGVNCVIVVTVQVLYAFRVYKLGRHFNWTWPIVVGSLVTVGGAVALMLIIKVAQAETFHGLREISWVVYIPLAVLTAIDGAIATAMWYYLSRSKTSFERTNHIIITIIRLSFASGFLTSAASLAALIAYATMANNLVFLGIEFLLTKLYVVSYVTMLNARSPSNYASDSSVGDSSANISKIVNIQTTTSVHISPSEPYTPTDKNSIPLSPTARSFASRQNEIKWQSDSNTGYSDSEHDLKHAV